MVAPRSFPMAGGVETHIHEVSRRLAARDYDVTILSTDPTGRLAASEWTEGVRTLRVPAWPRDRDYYIAPSMYRIAASGEWDIVHVQGYNTAVPPIAMSAAIRAGSPFVLTFHSGGHSSRLRNSARFLQHAALRPLLARAGRLICVSDFELDFFSARLRLAPDRFVVIPNGSHFAAATDQETAFIPDPAAPLIVSIGRLERYKGHHRLIDAMPAVLRTLPGAQLKIVGSGPLGEELQRQVDRLGLAGSVWIGSIDPRERDTMARTLSQASLVALLSDYEAHPISVMEALALGRPVVVTHTSGLAELADRGLVRSIPLESNSDNVAAALLHNLRQPLTAPQANLPSWDDCSDQLGTLYRGVLEARSCAS